MLEIITMSGDIGGGKSSVAKFLNKIMGYEIIGTGTIQRQIAEHRGITTLDLNRLSQTDRSIDDEIDSYVIELGKNRSQLIIDSRLAWHFIPGCFKVYLSVDANIGAERVFNDDRDSENNPSLQATFDNNLSRQKLERDRFKKLYNINFKDYSNYNIVIDTSYASPEEIAQTIHDSYVKWKSNICHPSLWVSPKILIPTHSIRSIEQETYNQIVSSIQENNYDSENTIDLFIVRGFIYIWDGHKRVIAATKLSLSLIPAMLLSQSLDYELIKGLSASKVAFDLDINTLYDWEDALRFKFKSYPEHDEQTSLM